jgi:hypothetical protein
MFYFELFVLLYLQLRKHKQAKDERIMISKAVKKIANDNGFDFYVSGLGYRQSAQITTLGDKPQAVSRCSNNSKDALQAINALITQRKLDAKSGKEIATEAIEVIADLFPPVADIDPTVAEQTYLELLPVDQWALNRAARIAAQGALTADDFASTYTRRDDFGDDAFALSGRYGCGALI